MSIVRPLRDRTALEKHRVILECTVSSTRCEVSWFKGDEELESSDRMELVSEGCYHKLTIHKVAVEDEGTYGIEVGEHRSSCKLMVEGERVEARGLLGAPRMTDFDEVSLALKRENSKQSHSE